MTLPTNILEQLAVRCEQATGPDRELDAFIYVTLFGMPYNRDVPAPAYSASLDAAMSLVPPATERIQQEQVRMSDGSVRCWASIDGWPVSPRRCASPALALTAACLRARSQDQSHGR